MSLRRLLPILALALTACRSQTHQSSTTVDGVRFVARIQGCLVREFTDTIRNTRLYVVEGVGASFPCGIAVIPDGAGPTTPPTDSVLRGR